MERRFFSLEIHKDNIITKIFRFLLGLFCLIIAGYWLIRNLKTSSTGLSIWVVIIFLTCFGIYMIATAFGYGYTYIEFSKEKIRIKNNSFLPVREIKVSDIEKITIYPLKFVIKLKNSKKITTRFGISDAEKNETIKEELVEFADSNNILSEYQKEI
ncbi:MAG TPA: hypothetical protein PLN06_04055 [Bacteroidales bacterium]|nr:hypothetical protein [Bacteroidales bacterium]HOU95780.1 hypothetical protein [Bacteroidales bacterium]HQG36565.1 hypothetical protein [Bacteroidales bacterium]HQG52930.1 hypothetical protein [Bacteroidales bacterium]HQJ21028.1 hypothetical protein [Bacteroidales bacterium]